MADFQKGEKALSAGDYETALRELRPLAEQGHAESQHNLGEMYAGGDGVAQDSVQMAYWWHKAAEQGFAIAQYDLGVAAGNGCAKAQYYLGLMYASGKGVPKDYVAAHMWFNLAAAQGVELAAEERDEVAKLMTPDQITGAQRLASKWTGKNPK